MDEMLEPTSCEWRGIGFIPDSGLKLNDKYAEFDASKKFPGYNEAYITTPKIDLSCIAGDIMKGYKQTSDCPHFGTKCNPEHPIGAPMVSDEGVCSAYYRYCLP